jgi:hypothetical protein
MVNMRAKWYQKATVQAAIVGGAFLILAALVPAVLLHIFKELDSSRSAGQDADALINILELSYYVALVGPFEDIHQHTKDEESRHVVVELQTYISERAAALNLRHHYQETRVNLALFYRNQLQTSIQRDFFNAGLFLGILQPMSSIMQTHRGDEYGKAAQTEYDDYRLRLTLLLTKYGLEDTLEWLRENGTHTEQPKTEGAARVELFMSKLKSDIRRKY